MQKLHLPFPEVVFPKENTLQMFIMDISMACLRLILVILKPSLVATGLSVVQRLIEMA